MKIKETNGLKNETNEDLTPPNLKCMGTLPFDCQLHCKFLPQRQHKALLAENWHLSSNTQKQVT
jgi:hypothetical protein